MMRIAVFHRAFFSILLFAVPGTVGAQDPVKVAPEAYRPGFENEYVKVTRVHYAPRVKIPAHDHTETGAAYVYLNDSGPVIFRHIDLSYGAITRPATKAGSFRLYKAVKEVHGVENPNDTPSDFLRVEFKTAPDTAKPLRGKFYRGTSHPGENFEQVQFENEQIRVTRFACAKGKACDISAHAAGPALIVALTPARFEARGKAASFGPGETKWIKAGQKEVIKSTIEEPVELLRFEFKTGPLPGSAGEKTRPHAHPHQ